MLYSKVLPALRDLYKYKPQEMEHFGLHIGADEEHGDRLFELLDPERQPRVRAVLTSPCLPSLLSSFDREITHTLCDILQRRRTHSRRRAWQLLRRIGIPSQARRLREVA